MELNRRNTSRFRNEILTATTCCPRKNFSRCFCRVRTESPFVVRGHSTHHTTRRIDERTSSSPSRRPRGAHPSTGRNARLRTASSALAHATRRRPTCPCRRQVVLPPRCPVRVGVATREAHSPRTWSPQFDYYNPRAVELFSSGSDRFIRSRVLRRISRSSLSS